MDRHHPAPGAADARARIALDPHGLATARAALAVFGPVQRQEPIEWAAEEPLAPDLADVYRHVGPEWVEIDTLGLPVPVFTDVVEMTLALCAVGAAWAGADEPFTPDWHVRPEVTDAVVAGLTGVLGTAERAVPLARSLGYPAAG